MNLYIVKIDPKDFDYDQCDSCVVVAENENQARFISELPGKLSGLSVTLIGTSNKDYPCIIHASFVRG